MFTKLTVTLTAFFLVSPNWGSCQKPIQDWRNGLIFTNQGEVKFGRLEQTNDGQKIRFYYTKDSTAVLGPDNIRSYCYIGQHSIVSYHASGKREVNRLAEKGYPSSLFVNVLVSGPAICIYQPVSGENLDFTIATYKVNADYSNIGLNDKERCHCEFDELFQYLKAIHVYDKLAHELVSLPQSSSEERLSVYRKINREYIELNGLPPDLIHSNTKNPAKFYLGMETGVIRLSSTPFSESGGPHIKPIYGNISRISFGITLPDWKTAPLFGLLSEVTLTTCRYVGRQVVRYTDYQGVPVYTTNPHYAIQLTGVGAAGGVYYYLYRHLTTGLYIGLTGGINVSWYNTRDAVIKADTTAFPNGQPLRINRYWEELYGFGGLRLGYHKDFFVKVGAYHSYADQFLEGSLSYRLGFRYHF
jgi:hypothetical protein